MTRSNQSNTSRWTRLLAGLFAFSLLAAACGGSDEASTDEDATGEQGGGQEAGAVDEAAADEAVAGAVDAERAAGSTATNLEELEAEWAASRQAVVDLLTEGIEAGEYGIGEDNVLRGPGSFEIDLNSCPGDWSNTQGIGDTILIAQTTALSGNAAAYGNIPAGWQAYLDHVNANGGIGGLEVELLAKDDGYVATQTIELIDELLQSDKPFTISTLGSPNSLAVYDTLNNNCVPHPFAQTGHPAWGDPVNHPWTTGLQMSYTTEAILWGAWIKENLSEQLPVKVGALVMDNDFGLAYELGFDRFVHENPDVVSEFQIVRHDPTAPTVTNEMTTLAAGQPDVFIAMTTGTACPLSVEEGARTGLNTTAVALFSPSVCKDPAAFMIPAGDAGDGWLIVGGGQKISTDPQYADDVFVKFANETLEAAGLDPSIGLYFTGFVFGWPHVEAMRIANDLPDGLTRTNFILAMRSLDLQHPGFVDGISFSALGAEDAYYVEGSDFSRYDAAAQSWIEEGGIVDLNGSSPNCNWSSTGC